MPKIKTGKDCCGCTACASICPKDAIQMMPDSMGFKFPKIDMSKCVECGQCERVCAFNDEYKTPDNYKTPIPYGVRQKDEEELMKSRSGGAFPAFANFILDKGGVIYGVGYKDHFVVSHRRIDNSVDLDELRGSKYVQSDLDGIFRQVKSDLVSGKWVLFSGTGCQTSGLSSYIPDKLKEKLVLVDIVCHGVPGPNLWRDYLEYVEKRAGRKVEEVDFRNKKIYGWKAHHESFRFAKSTTTTTTTYTYLFYQHIMLRESCENCQFTNLRRTGDLTIADFWGWDKTDKDFNKDDKGASLVLVNTPKGMDLFNSVKAKFDIIEPKIEDCMQTHLMKPTVQNAKRDVFIKDYERKGFEYIMKKYGNVGWRYVIKSLSGKVLRRMKRVMGF